MPGHEDSQVPLTLGLYFDDFVYYLESDEVERLFERILSEQIRSIVNHIICYPNKYKAIIRTLKPSL